MINVLIMEALYTDAEEKTSKIENMPKNIVKIVRIGYMEGKKGRYR